MTGKLFYVLWTNHAGIKCWSGPYDSFDDASRSTPMMDRQAGAIVTMREMLWAACGVTN